MVVEEKISLPTRQRLNVYTLDYNPIPLCFIAQMFPTVGHWELVRPLFCLKRKQRFHKKPPPFSVFKKAMILYKIGKLQL